MFVRIVNLKASRSRKEEMKKLADKFIPMIESQPGCQGAKFFHNETEKRYGIVVQWASEKDADNSKAIIGPQLIPKLQELADGDVDILLYEVFER